MRVRTVRPFLKVIAALAVIAALPIVPSACALDQELQITVDGFTTTFAVPNGGSATTPGNLVFHGVTINATISDNNPGTASSSFLQSDTVTLRDTDGNSHTVSISAGDTNWTAPTTPPNVVATSSLGGTSTTTGASNLTLTSYVDTANGQNSTPAGGSLGAQTTYTSGNIGSGGGASFDLTTAAKTFTTLHSPFSMTSVVSVSLSGAAVVNFTTDLVLTQVPEPSTMALAGLGALGFIGYGVRRRKARTA
jgi:hypothetical protein